MMLIPWLLRCTQLRTCFFCHFFDSAENVQLFYAHLRVLVDRNYLVSNNFKEELDKVINKAVRMW